MLGWKITQQHTEPAWISHLCALGIAPRRMQELGTRFEPSLWGCAAAAHFILPQKCIQHPSQQLSSLKLLREAG